MDNKAAVEHGRKYHYTVKSTVISPVFGMRERKKLFHKYLRRLEGRYLSIIFKGTYLGLLLREKKLQLATVGLSSIDA